ncbi:MAG: hypothetical protein R3C41_17475 [Calditrichia bacterium]
MNFYRTKTLKILMLTYFLTWVIAFSSMAFCCCLLTNHKECNHENNVAAAESCHKMPEEQMNSGKECCDSAKKTTGQQDSTLDSNPNLLKNCTTKCQVRLLSAQLMKVEQTGNSQNVSLSIVKFLPIDATAANFVPKKLTHSFAIPINSHAPPLFTQHCAFLI